jgi:hypothetical protein
METPAILELSLTRFLFLKSGENRLTGPIPTEFASLESLRVLFLSAFCFPVFVSSGDTCEFRAVAHTLGLFLENQVKMY